MHGGRYRKKDPITSEKQRGEATKVEEEKYGEINSRGGASVVHKSIHCNHLNYRLTRILNLRN